ncbi:MAG TPA: hypothetical protein VE258_17860, partial [Ktedonobacterales bacterium]|nr:hypothetical protein [Ktedonobacterales bacterium]
AIAIENSHQAQRIYELEHQLVSLALTEADIGNTTTGDLQRVVQDHLRLARAIVEELHARKAPLPDELQEPL